ncbi:SURF1 family protein [Glaciecola siphonariae]|uniref:SURF1-like protein n=1 Tax=Glaciecola siphonariae TaxID=521012 RepID=A0ABV9LQ73_9ALTE
MLFKGVSTLRMIFTLMAIVCIVIMFLLGFWQLDRKYQKEQRLNQIEQRKAADPQLLEDVIDAPADFVDFPLLVTGELSDKTFFIDNRIKNGVAGYEVLAPLASNYGTVLVNLGWVPGTGNRSELPRIIIPKDAQYQGRIYVPSDNVMISETNFNYGRFPVLIQQIDFAEIEKHLGKDVLPFTLRLDQQPDSAYIRDWQVVVMAPERHLGYAIQWFGLGIAGLTVFLLTIMKSMQIRKEQIK